MLNQFSDTIIRLAILLGVSLVSALFLILSLGTIYLAIFG